MPVRLLLLGRITETGPSGMHERLVVAALEIDIGGIAEDLTKDH